MPDLDRELRDIAHALVADAPPPPSFGSDPVPVPLSPHREARRPLTLVAATAAAAVVVVGALAMVADDNEATTRTSVGAPAASPQSVSAPCDLPFTITVPGAATAVDGPAPGRPATDDGQRARHWRGTDAIVEARWPAAPAPIYGDGPRAMPSAGWMSSGRRTEIDVAPSTDSPPPSNRPDVVIEPSSAPAAAPCELLELTVMTDAGRWTTGLRAATSSGAEAVDLRPRVVERRAVDVAPRTAIRCRGADADGTPPNRFGGPRTDLRGAQPVDALLAFVAATPGSPQSGYVEMTAPDGSVTYGADDSGVGWTLLVTVAPHDSGWHVRSWTSSGC